MDTASFIIGVVVGVAVSGVAFALTVFLFPRLFRPR
jgi:gas vesicle protein